MMARGRERGSASVEITLAAPLAIFLLLLIVQYAMWAHATHIAQAAANTGVQAARVHGGSQQAGHADTQAVLDQMAGTVLTGASVTVELTGTDANVTVTGHAMAVIPGMSVPVHASVTAPRELIPGTP
jgi:Flp pilus assembly protein TadG